MTEWNECSQHIITTLNLKQTSKGEWHGACPHCGGKDRFWIKEHNSEVRVHCRQCGDFKAIRDNLRSQGLLPKFEPTKPVLPARYDVSGFEDTRPYHERKGVQLNGAELHGKNVKIAMRNMAGEIVGHQHIMPDGSKRWTPGMTFDEPVFHVVGSGQTVPTYICEGWADAVSLYEATGMTAIFACSANHLPIVAKALNARRPNTLIIAADYDKPGLKTVAEAGLPFVLPPQGSDWNDLYRSGGAGSVAEALDHTFFSGDADEMLATLQSAPEAPQTTRVLVEGSPNFPDYLVQKNGVKVLATRENLEALIDWAEMDIRYDVYRRDIVAWYNGQEVTDTVDAIVKSLAAKHGLPASTVVDQLDAVARARPLNKPLHWLLSLPKTEGDPLEEWLTACGMVDPQSETPIQKQWGYIIWRRFFVGCCAAADQLERTTRKDALPKFEEVIVLVSEQGQKKTSAIRGLLPPDLRGYFGGGTHLQTSVKDSVIGATSNWIAEIGELDATFRKSDISALKAFLSMTEDCIRMPYDRRAKWYPRRTVFFATVNEPEFLQDLTGNRRYLPIELRQELVFSEENGARIFAQAWQRYATGDQWWLADDEVHMICANQTGRHGNRFIERLRDAFVFESERRDLKLKPSAILAVLGYQGDAVARNTKALAHALKELGVQKADGSYTDRRCYLMPPMQDDALSAYRRLCGDD